MSLDSTSGLGRTAGILSISKFLERFCYYGGRALFVVFLTEAGFGLDFDDAIGLYAKYSLIVIIGQAFGGVISDLILRPKLTMIVGLMLQVVGYLMFYKGYESVTDVGIWILGVGYALYIPSNVSLLSSNLRKSSMLLFGIFLFVGLYNAGAITSILISSGRIEEIIPEAFLWLAIITFLNALLILPLTDFKDKVRPDTDTKWGMGLFGAVCMAAFWFGYSILLEVSFSSRQEIFFEPLGLFGLEWADLYPILITIFNLLALIFHKSLAKYIAYLGAIAALGVVVMGLFEISSDVVGIDLRVYSVVMDVLIALLETLFMAVCYIFMIRHFNPRYYGTLFGITFMMIGLSSGWYGNLEPASFIRETGLHGLGILWSGIIFAIMGMCWIMIARKNPSPKSKTVSEDVIDG